MTDAWDRTRAAADHVLSRAGVTPKLAFILGSGLGAWADTIDEPQVIPYSEIPGFTASTVAGHAGNLVVGSVHGVPVVAMQGRVHAYEGIGLDSVVFGLRTMWQMGARTVVITNAAGGLNADWTPGDLMLIRDHVNMTGMSPLVGHNDARFGPRFPDMTETWTPALAEVARAAASKLDVTLREGVYVGVLGPAYETPAEVRLFGQLGGDAVGMSTVPEAIVARHMGMRILGISTITNLGSGLSGAALDHSEVQEVAASMRDRFMQLLDGIVAGIAAADLA